MRYRTELFGGTRRGGAFVRLREAPCITIERQIRPNWLRRFLQWAVLGNRWKRIE